MSSIIEGYNYDIFISYRQKDNKGDKWVSDFVESLRTELESTFKEDISIYFDENPHDGLLETHDVDASLREKLKCLIFIPIISRTFCDPKAFAWQHEFLAFIEQSSADKFGLRVTLPNGNVATRVLPVRIHELGIEDTQLCEGALGSPLRGVDFIYKAPGVNRPLRREEDHPKDNLNKTYYRDQINKVANAIDEIIQSVNKNIVNDSPPAEKKDVFSKSGSTRFKASKINGRKTNLRQISFLILGLVLLSVSTLLFLKFRNNLTRNSIGVFANTNPSDDPALTKSAIAFLDEIIIKLKNVEDITVISSSISKQYLNNPVPIEKLKNDYGINYTVDFTLSGDEGKRKLWVGLSRTKDFKQLWAKQYDLNENLLMPLFTNIVYSISEYLNIDISAEEKSNLEKNQTNDPVAYRSFLAANGRLFTAIGNLFVDSASFSSAVKMYDKAIELDSGFAEAYARRAIARAWGIYTRQLDRTESVKCFADITSATNLNNNLPDLNIAKGFYYYYCVKDYINALLNFNTAATLDQEDYQPLFYMAMVYRKMGDWNKSQALIHRVLKFNPKEAMYLTNIGLSYAYLHNFDSALIFQQKAIEANPNWPHSYYNIIETHVLNSGTTKEARALLDSANQKIRSELLEVEILLDIYDRKYADALRKTEAASQPEFRFGGNRYLTLALIYRLMDERDLVEKNFRLALNEFEKINSRDSLNAETHSNIGLSLAGLGIKERAISEGLKAIAIAKEDKNSLDEIDMNLNLAKIYSILGKTDLALDIIEHFSINPACFSIKQLQIDPIWDPIRNNPRYMSIIKTTI